MLKSFSDKNSTEPSEFEFKYNQRNTKKGGINNMQHDIGSKLIGNINYLDHGFGGKAQEIYDKCCNRFGWDRHLRGEFGMQRLLYAQDATREGYSVWFLAHSNLTESKGGKWKNTILPPDTIEEEYKEENQFLYKDGDVRVTFAKTKNNGYVFLGLFRPERIDKRRCSDGTVKEVKIYKMVSNVYPM